MYFDKLKCILLVNFIFFTSTLCAQKSFSSEYEARYTLDYKISNQKSAKSQLTTFILLMNEKESYFKSMNVYVEDSLRYYKKIKESGNPLKDLNTFSKFYAEYPENIGTTLGKLYITTPVTTANVSYEESNIIQWKLVNEYKTIGKDRCQKATTTKYGRNWIAYFNPIIPFNFGPYKFNGLPGLIMELYDDKNDFHYTLYKFKKRKTVCHFANSYKNVKPTKKEKVYQWKKNSFLSTDYSEVLKGNDAEIIRQIEANKKKMYDNYNPIELKID